jgi:hypothetical protein
VLFLSRHKVNADDLIARSGASTTWRKLEMMRYFIVFLFVALLLFGEASVFAQDKNQTMTNADVIKMLQSGMSEAAIIGAIKAATPNFEVTDDSILALRQQKVPEAIILAMIKRQWQVSSARPKVHKAAPDYGPKWEIEVHGGIPGNLHQTVVAENLPTAEAYSLAGSGAVGYWDKRVSSWYFGDGANLAGLSASLDPILSKSIVQTHGQLFGVRASRRLNGWMAAEFSFDRGGTYALTDEGLAQVEAARAGFEHTWSRLDVPGNTPSTSVSNVTRFGGHQSFATGAIVIGFPQTNRVKPYVTVGAGMMSSRVTPSVTLVGSYGGPSIPETDSVRLTFVQDRSRAFTEVLGGGIKIYLNAHWGIRLDARAYMYHNPISTLLDASHTNTSDGAWVINATDSAGTSVGFLQKLSGPGFAAYSSLSGPAISGLKTNVGSSSMQRQVPLTLGFFWRF